MRNSWLLVLGLLCLVLSCRQEEPPRPETVPVQVDRAPFPSQGLTVLIVEDVQSRRNLPLSQLSILTSVALREKLQQLQADYRIWDDNVERPETEPKFYQAYQLKRDSLPWIYISNGKRGYSGPLPATLAETLQLIEKYRP